MIRYEIKTNNCYENMWIYCILIIVNLLHVSVTFCGIFRKVFLRRMYYEDRPHFVASSGGCFYEGCITKIGHILWHLQEDILRRMYYEDRSLFVASSGGCFYEGCITKIGHILWHLQGGVLRRMYYEDRSHFVASSGRWFYEGCITKIGHILWHLQVGDFTKDVLRRAVIFCGIFR